MAYPSVLVRQHDNCRLVEASFSPPDMLVEGVLLRQGDHFLEQYHSDRWYNIFRISCQHTGILKGWYCNICRPALFLPDEIRWVDLALDLFIFPDGDTRLLDQDEFADLRLSPETRTACWQAVESLLVLARTKNLP